MGRVPGAAQSRARVRFTNLLKPTRILFVSSVGVLGGAEQSLLGLAVGLDRSRFSPSLACLGDGSLADAARAVRLPTTSVEVPPAFSRTSLRARRSGFVSSAAGALSAMPIAWKLRRVIRQCSAQIVHTNGNKAHLVGTLAAAGLGIPVVWHVRDFLQDRALERFLVWCARPTVAAYVANSQAVADCLVRRGANAARVHPIPNGIDCERHSPEGPVAEVRAQFGWPSDTVVIAVVGALAPWKGHELFLDAAVRVAATESRARFLIVGGELYVTAGHAGYGDRLRERVRALGLEGRVGFTGHRDDVPDVLRATDLVVHMPAEPEPFGRVVAEAMACGRPLVTRADGGTLEVAGCDGSVTLVPPGSVEALANAVVNLLRDPAAAARARRARTRIEEMFSIRAHVVRVESLYAALVTQSQAELAAPQGVQPRARF